MWQKALKSGMIVEYFWHKLANPLLSLAEEQSLPPITVKLTIQGGVVASSRMNMRQ
jgi:hypothetical protein